MFDMPRARYGAAVTANDETTARAFNTYVANFVKNGDPNGAGLSEWPPFDPTTFDLMHFTLDDGPVFENDLREERVQLVEQAAEQQ